MGAAAAARARGAAREGRGASRAACDERWTVSEADCCMTWLGGRQEKTGHKLGLEGLGGKDWN
jgi:hypothetical protein